MAKRFISTELISEDWYLEMESDVKLFFIYATLKCDHAGFLKVNLRAFNALHETDITADQILRDVNTDKIRFRVISDRLWLLEDFIPFQYGSELNPKNRVHSSIISIFEKNGVLLSSIKGLGWGSDGVKDKEKDKDMDMDISVSDNIHARAEIPSLEEVHESMKRWLTVQGISLNQFPTDELAQKFMDHYGAQGWMRSNGMPVYKWQPLVNNWMAGEKSRIFKAVGTASGAMATNVKTEKKWHNKN